MNLILITSAIKEELIDLENWNEFEFSLNDELYKILIFPIGIGKLNALYNLMYWFYNTYHKKYKKYHLKEILFLGSCGSYNINYKENIIYSNKYMNIDFASIINKAKILEDISKVMETTQGFFAKCIINHYKWQTGIVNSTDSVTLTQISEIWIKNQFPELKEVKENIFENLEVYGIAKFCIQHQIAFTSFLTITNAVYENGSIEWQKNYRKRAKNLNKKIKKYFQSILESSFS
ncbi:MAG: hypothetical protein KatS3mg129_2534 [Leptospiraceae bacterium]|nr:MAG: hypothetical protein KatS3mg129_2534 [Leptospiraceae bacterium]